MSSRPQSPRILTATGLARTAIAGLLALASAACGDPLEPGDPPEEQLLFVSTAGDDRQADWTELLKDVYRMDADGTASENLTRQPAPRYRSFSLSPDGSKLAFNSDRTSCYGIWVMNADGSSPVQLTGAGDRCSYSPRWSPDGTRIAFTSSREQRWSLYVMNADGSNPRNVSSPVDQQGGFMIPVSWSPDGRVVFQHFGSADGVGFTRTYVVNPDGTGLQPLFARTGDHSPAWSPDGSRIAFISDRDGSPDLFVMNADGSGVRKLSTLPGEELFVGTLSVWQSEYSPWSPDGRWIAFNNDAGQSSGFDLKYALYVVNADGSGLRQLAAHEFGAVFNGWSPGGTRIALTSTAGGSRDVYVINADGSGLTNLTRSPAHESDALWLPRR